MSSNDSPEAPGVLDVGVFLAELAMLAALVYVGVTLPSSVLGRIALVVALLAVFLVVWGRWLAPRAPRRLAPRPGLALKMIVFAVGAVLLAGTGAVGVAIVFLVLTEGVVVAAEVSRKGRP